MTNMSKYTPFTYWMKYPGRAPSSPNCWAAWVRLLRAVGNPFTALRAVHPDSRVPSHPSRDYIQHALPIIILFIAILGTFQTTQAQWHKWQIGAGAGSLTYNGDLSDKFVNIHLQEPGYHLFAERKLVQSIYLRLESVNGHLRGTDRAKSGLFNRGIDNPNYFRSLNFRTSIHDIHLTGVFYLNLGKQREMMPRVAPYARAGIGVGIFNVYGDLIYNETGGKYYYWDDGFIRDRAPNDPDVANAQIIKRDGDFETNLRKLEIEKSYSRFKWQVPVAFGLKFRLSEKSSLNLEVQYTYNMTDYIDNVSDLPARADISDIFTLYAADPAGYIFNQPRNLNKKNNLNDSYLYLSTGMSFHLGSTAPPRFKSPVFYPGLLLSFTPVDSFSDKLPIDGIATDTIARVDSATIVMAQQLQEEMNLVSDSLFRSISKRVLDSLIRNDLNLYATLLPGQLQLIDDANADSITVVKDSIDNNRWLLQYHSTLNLKSTADIASGADSIKMLPVIYRIDTLTLDSFSVSKTVIPQKAEDIPAEVLSTAKVAGSSYFLPVIDSTIVAEQLAEDTVATTTVALKRVPAPPASPMLVRDTVMVREKIIERTLDTDTALHNRMKSLQESMNALQLKTGLPAQTVVNVRLDSINRAMSNPMNPYLQTPYQVPPYPPVSRELSRKERKKQEKVVGAAYAPAPAYTYAPKKTTPLTIPVVIPLPIAEAKTVKEIKADTAQSKKEEAPLNDTLSDTAVSELAGDSIPSTTQTQVVTSPVSLELKSLQAQLKGMQAAQDSILKMLASIRENQTTQQAENVSDVASPDTAQAIQMLLNQPSVKVFFGVGQSFVSASFHGALDKIAAQLQQYPSLRIELRGFADPTGNAVANLKLSEKRADSVKQYLIRKHQLSTDSIAVLPSGQENDSKDLAYSRRVEVRIIR